MIRRRADIDDLDSLFDRDEAERRRQQRTEVVNTARERMAQLEAQDAIDREAVKQSMRAANNEFLIREYEHAGVEPPMVDGAGVPTCSLSMLFRMHWTIEEVDGVKVLVAPPNVPQKGRSTP